MKTKTIFEKSQKGQHAYSLPKEDAAFSLFQPPKAFLRKSSIPLPEISELDLMRHFTWLAGRNMGIDNAFYPLGSCTMKYNPRINELVARLPGFVHTHPLAPEESVQGNLKLIYELTALLCQICGLHAGTLLPNAGAQGEFTGVKLIRAYHQERGDLKRVEMLIPDSAHGTNPATASMAGLKTISIPTDAHGDLDIEQLRRQLSERTAGLMITNPNTLGLFSPKILEITKMIHDAGGLVYYDGANLNPLLNVVRPGAMGVDVMHLNLHKTFSTPHGGGGPGSGPVLCHQKLEQFLPLPKVVKENDQYRLIWNDKASIGQMVSFHGNFAIYLRAYLYITLHGQAGLRRIAEVAAVNANYLKAKLGNLFVIPFSQPCMHEFVAQTYPYLDQGVKTLDIAKRLLDYGVYAPTIYFPLILKECMLIEPTESESKETLDQFVVILEKIVDEIKSDSELVKNAPHNKPVSRLDEVRAAKHPVLKAF